MIIGVILRNFKVYRNLTYIPLSNNEPFCSLIGKNGIGKSSVLEALDFYFNGKEFKKNNSGSSKPEECYVVPIFCIKRCLIQSNYVNLVSKFNDAIWNVVDNLEDFGSRINSNYQELIRVFVQQIRTISIDRNDYFLLPLGKDIEKNLSFGFFKDSSFLNQLAENTSGNSTEELNDAVLKEYSPLLEKIPEQFQYVYIPKDIEPENLIRFETQELQTLLGTNLTSIVSKYISKDQISDISRGLKDFVDDLSAHLPKYKFKAPTTYQANLRPDRIYKLIIEDFFSTRQLHKEGADRTKDIPLKELSSGEKQQAILTLIHSLVKEYRNSDLDGLIIAVDEPESSLHISACYEQFEKLYEVGTFCDQVIVSSHWYGFIPAIPRGTITNITNISGRTSGHIFNIQKYREEIKHQDADYSKNNHNTLPIDISLKSSNDFIQSILMSVIAEEPYNWLICEGSSDKIYLDAYMDAEIKNKRLRIIPVCSATEVKNTYNRLRVLFEELRTTGQLKGKVFLLTDTDSNLLEFETSPNLEDNLRCRRIVNVLEDKDTKLVKITANPKSPNTDIEDALNGAIYNKVLQSILPTDDLYSFITSEEKAQIPSLFAMDFRPTEMDAIDKFISDGNGKNKVLFARKYVEILKQGDYDVPRWVQEIKNFFDND